MYYITYSYRNENWRCSYFIDPWALSVYSLYHVYEHELSYPSKQCITDQEVVSSSNSSSSSYNQSVDRSVKKMLTEASPMSSSIHTEVFSPHKSNRKSKIISNDSYYCNYYLYSCFVNWKYVHQHNNCHTAICIHQQPQWLQLSQVASRTE